MRTASRIIYRTFSTTVRRMGSTASLRPIVICGPSGAGKSTILKKLFADFPDKFGFSISHTTRSPRSGEEDGREYHFVPREKFESMIDEQAFVEHAQFGGNRYGTSKAAIRDVANTGTICILDIEMEGVKQIQKTDLGARCLFLSPPSFEVLETRLRGRATDNEDAITKRLDKARVEMEFGKSEGVFEKFVVNDDLDKAYTEVRDWVEDGGKFGQRT